jgi:hypothetical protein
VTPAAIRRWVSSSRTAQGLPTTPTAEEIARVISVVAPSSQDNGRPQKAPATSIHLAEGESDGDSIPA